MNTTVEIRNLDKSYGDRRTLYDVSFAVNRGEIFALLGVNGAGKTTTLECVEGIRKQKDTLRHFRASLSATIFFRGQTNTTSSSTQ